MFNCVEQIQAMLSCYSVCDGVQLEEPHILATLTSKADVVSVHPAHAVAE
jgi:hypothetical protein